MRVNTIFSVVFYLIRTVRKLALRLLETEHLTNGDQLKVIDIATETFVFGSTFTLETGTVPEPSRPQVLSSVEVSGGVMAGTPTSNTTTLNLESREKSGPVPQWLQAS
jgi:hypothetical protein